MLRAHHTDYTYFEFPKYFVRTKENKWRPRKQGKVVPRVYSCSPREGERYYLRLLLLHVKGATSYEFLKTFNGHVYGTFKEACRARELIHTDDSVIETLREAESFQMPFALRDLFASMLLFNEPNSPQILWDLFKKSFAADSFNRLAIGSEESRWDIAYNKALIHIQQTLQQNGKSLKDFHLPEPIEVEENELILQHTNYDQQELNQFVEAGVPTLNPEQKKIYELATNSALNNEGKLLFCTGVGGSGKTHVFKLILAKLRGSGKIALAVSSSGISALLLPDGRTAHSMFKIPIQVDENSMCNIKKNSALGELMRRTSLILWDECVMMNKHCVEALDRTLKDVRSVEEPFGGITMLFGGDWRQTLCVLPNASPNQVIASTIKYSNFWHRVQTEELIRNMRVFDDFEYATWLLSIGNGSINNFKFADKHMIPDLDQLILKVFPDINNVDESSAILSATNSNCDMINDIILNQLQSEEMVYQSQDCLMNAEQGYLYPVEYLNSLNHPSMPPAKLRLRLGKLSILFLL